LSDGLSFCRAIYKGSSINFKRVKLYDVVEIKDFCFALINGLYFSKPNFLIRVMILNDLPKVLFTNIDTLIGKPEDHLTLSEKLAKIASRARSVEVPKTAVPPMVAIEKGEEIKANPEAVPVPEQKIEEEKIYDLKDLNEKIQKWRIKVRVVKKCEKKSCRGGEGSMQTIQLVDKNGTEIEALLFNDAIREKGDLLADGNVYIIRDGQIRTKNKQFSTITSNLVLYLNWKTAILPQPDDPNIPLKVYFFLTISLTF